MPRCRLKEFNGSGYRRRTIMDNNDQTVTKLGRNGVRGGFLPVDDAALQRHVSMASHVPVFSGSGYQRRKAGSFNV